MDENWCARRKRNQHYLTPLHTARGQEFCTCEPDLWLWNGLNCRSVFWCAWVFLDNDIVAHCGLTDFCLLHRQIVCSYLWASVINYSQPLFILWPDIFIYIYCCSLYCGASFSCDNVTARKPCFFSHLLALRFQFFHFLAIQFTICEINMQRFGICPPISVVIVNLIDDWHVKLLIGCCWFSTWSVM